MIMKFELSNNYASAELKINMEWVKTAPKTTIIYICRVWKGAVTENDITINDVMKYVRPDCFKTKKG